MLERIEDVVNAHIRENVEVTIKRCHSMMPSKVGHWRSLVRNTENACGCSRWGTSPPNSVVEPTSHEPVTSAYSSLKAEAGVASGVRRVEATTGDGALEWVRQREKVLKEVGTILKGTEEDAVEKLEKLLVNVAIWKNNSRSFRTN